MRRLVLHLLVALLAFMLGVTAAMLLGSTQTQSRRAAYRTAEDVYLVPAEEVPPPPRRYACPHSRNPEAIPMLPMLPAVPLPPAADKVNREMRVRIKRTDGSVQVIKTAPAAR